MTSASHTSLTRNAVIRRASGFTLVELMIAMTISLLLLAGLVGLFVNMSRSSNEMAKTNSLIENGRYALQLIQEDLVHAGYWGGFVPEFDNLASEYVPGDVPTGVPDPCEAYAAWDGTYRNNLIGITVQAYETLPAGAGCVSPVAQRADTDVLVLRHAETCIPGVGDCDPDVAGALYLQVSGCVAEKNAGLVQDASPNTVELDATASATTGEYVGMTLRTVGPVGTTTGPGQLRTITAYNGATRVATVSPAWAIEPDGTTGYSFEYMLSDTSYPLHQRNCTGTGAPPTMPVTAGPLAAKRKFVSNIYYITDLVHPDRPTEVVPTLVISRFDLSGGTLAHQAPVASIEGIEAFRVELGIDNRSDTGALVNYANEIIWADPATKTSPTNRGDGTPDEFVRCTDAAPCTAAQLADVVAVKLYVLARSREPTPGYTDTKTYCVGEPDPLDGSCPVASRIAAANDGYKRHVFQSTVRLVNVSGRRDTP
jgi:prepilin-type N-terminal cleavage/methylation domain-containing protein